jgi:hypothetical protein
MTTVTAQDQKSREQRLRYQAGKYGLMLRKHYGRDLYWAHQAITREIVSPVSGLTLAELAEWLEKYVPQRRRRRL